MKETVKRLLAGYGIEYCGVLPIGEARIINPSLYERTVKDFARSVAVFIAPYAVEHEGGGNVSVYAAARDYHIFMKGLFGKVCAELERLFPGHRFYGMSDHSPINETHAAALVGLGVVGDNMRLINEKYGSYVFIGEIYTDAALESDAAAEPGECIHCGACAKACPAEFGVTCLSDVTQRKGELTPEEKAMMRRVNTAWGCDVCQKVCPLNRGKKTTSIPFFREKLIFDLTSGLLEAMSDEDFACRAYAWRKRNVIARNINILESE